jgi:hypothetical protein
MIEFELENWRRRPDLNRGWRFCRQGQIVYPVDSSCVLVGPTLPSYPVFGPYCSQIVPTFCNSLNKCLATWHFGRHFPRGRFGFVLRATEEQSEALMLALI